MSPARPPEWWRSAVLYQIYPRSFQDSNADGIGDLQGIIDRLDYLNDGTPNSLGIDGIWLSPTFPSPMKDFGYDVSDYRDVAPEFGDLATMDRLIEECHRRRIKLMLDFVPNHTSDQHPWFRESRTSRSNPRRDWYFWRDAKPDGSLPNNWRGAFGGPAWTFDPATGQYYLHSFLPEQPDLNWRNPDVVQAMHDVLRFWMQRGIDGFRIDVIGAILKHPDLADNIPDPRWTPGSPLPRYPLANNRNYPDVFEAVRGIRSVIDEFPGRMAVGEVFGSAEEISKFYGGSALDGLNLAFNFELIHETGVPGYTAWDAPTIARLIDSAEQSLPPGAQPCYALGNHDQPRFASRNDADGLGEKRARAAALLLLGLRGTPFLYYGDEIGMPDAAIPADRLRDPARFRAIGRDPERSPMQWDGTASRGFSDAEPWLPYGSADINVAAQRDDETSLLSLYRRAIWLRKRESALMSGTYQRLEAAQNVFSFLREIEDGRPVLVLLNTSTESTTVALPDGAWQVLATTEVDDADRIVTSQFTLPSLAGAWLGRS